MRRSHLIFLTGLSIDKLKNMIRRGASPLTSFVAEDGTVLEAGEDAKWRQYSPADVIRMAIAVEMIKAGLPQAVTGEFVRRNARAVNPFAKDSALAADIWFGAAIVPDDSPVSSMTFPYVPVAGPLNDMRLTTGQGTTTETFDTSEFEDAVDSLLVVNVSKIVRRISAHAQLMSFEDDFTNVLTYI